MDVLDQYVPDPERYDGRMPYRRCGRSGLDLPAISLGLWQNFGDDQPLATQRAILRRAFDLGVTHFDLANNYGPPYGSAELNFGRVLREDLRPFRDELVDLDEGGLRHVARALRRPRLAEVPALEPRAVADPDGARPRRRLLLAPAGARGQDPLEETMGALDTAVRQGKARYAGISSYSAARTAEAVRLLRDLGTPLLIHQPSYSMLNRWIEEDLLDVLGREGVGCIVFSPLAQGLLTDRYLDGIPKGSRAAREGSLERDMLNEENLGHVRALNEVARGRGQTLAQLAIAWALRDPRVTSALIGASSVAQLEDSLGAVRRLEITPDELEAIDRHAVEGGVNLWAASSAA